MRLAIFTDTYAPEINGVARTLGRLAKYLDTQQIPYQIFAPETSYPFPKIPQVHRFASLPFFLYPDCRLALPNPLQIQHQLKEFQPTLIHIATPFNLGLLGLQYGKKHQIPMVASYHTNFDAYLSYYNLQFLEKWFWRYMHWFHRPVQKVLVPSLSTQQQLIQHSIHYNIDIWARGVDSSFFSPYCYSNQVRKRYGIRQKYILLYVGRIAPEKDIQLALDTYHALPQELKVETHLLIVGDGPLYKELVTKEHPHITYTGFVEGEELAKIYASCDLFLFPSPTETFGNVVLEALSSGLPVIGARAGGVQYLVEHAKNGFLCPPQEKKYFVQAVTNVLTNPDLLASMKREARKFALSQSWEEIFKQLICSYREVEDQRKISTA